MGFVCIYVIPKVCLCRVNGRMKERKKERKEGRRTREVLGGRDEMLG